MLLYGRDCHLPFSQYAYMDLLNVESNSLDLRMGQLWADHVYQRIGGHTAGQ